MYRLKHRPRNVKKIRQPKTKTKLASIKCVTNPQHNTADKTSYGNANIAEELYSCSSE